MTDPPQIDYPKRDKFFAHKAFRKMHKSSAAADMGRDAFCLVAVVLHTEDAARYRGPVRFFNSQLMETLGFAKWETFDKARKRAIDSQWLQYRGCGKRTAGLYWVTVPVDLDDMDDLPIEESIDSLSPKAGYKEGYKVGYKEGYDRGVIEGINGGTIGGQSGVRSGDKQGYDQGINGGTIGGQTGGTIYPSPIPDPSPGPDPEPSPNPDPKNTYAAEPLVFVSQKRTRRPSVAIDRPEDISEHHWRDWTACRRKPVTESVLVRIRREAAKAGMSADEAIRTAAERQWEGFQADWLNNDRTTAAERKPSQPKTFAQIREENTKDVFRKFAESGKFEAIYNAVNGITPSPPSRSDGGDVGGLLLGPG
jgi:hypothetical protein